MAQGGSMPSLISDTADQAEVQEEVLKTELAKLEYEIQTLRSVLAVKMREANELKRRLGISPMAELKTDLMHGLQSVRESNTYQKTNAALRSFGGYASKKFGDLRNSSVFKSVEEKVGGAYSTVKMQVQSSRSENSLSSAARETQLSGSATNVDYKLPEEKVPL